MAVEHGSVLPASAGFGPPRRAAEWCSLISTAHHHHESCSLIPTTQQSWRGRSIFELFSSLGNSVSLSVFLCPVSEPTGPCGRGMRGHIAGYADSCHSPRPPPPTAHKKPRFRGVEGGGRSQNNCQIPVKFSTSASSNTSA